MNITAPQQEALTDEALALVGRLHEELDGRRRELLDARQELQARLDAGETLDFVSAPEDFTVAPVPDALQDRRVEITGPTSRKMVINALNSGARGFMADFEDSNSPYWRNMIEGQLNLTDAIQGSIEHDEKGKHYELEADPAVLHVRPRGLHLPEAHLEVDGSPVAGAFFDFGVYVHRNAEALLERGWGPYFYIPKLESHHEAALWRDAFLIAEETLGLDRGTIKATVLIETIPAAFCMDAILYELRDHAAGLNAGRWDYIFSVIKRFRSREEFVMPDRSDVTMTVPFMKSYSDLVVKTCHARGAHAMGGMAAVIPSRTDEEANKKAFEAVREDKQREAEAGFDGTWVAHPDVVDTALEAFDAVLGDKENQIDKQREDVSVTAAELLDAGATPGDITEEGLRNDVAVGFQYISFWLGGRGAAGINNMMEDAATAEISRSQIWQWVKHGKFSREKVLEVLDEETSKIHEEVGDDVWEKGRPDETHTIFESVALSDDFPEFLTLLAYEYLD